MLEDNLQLMHEVMKNCIVVRCEMRYDIDGFDYTAICKDFDEVPPGEMAPYYTPIFHEVDDDYGKVYTVFEGWQK